MLYTWSKYIAFVHEIMNEKNNLKNVTSEFIRNIFVLLTFIDMTFYMF